MNEAGRAVGPPRSVAAARERPAAPREAHGRASAEPHAHQRQQRATRRPRSPQSKASGREPRDAARRPPQPTTHHREREVAGVAGADEDAVEREDDRRRRLHEANSGHMRAPASITAGSLVNARGMTSVSASRTPPKSTPDAERPADHPPGRRDGASRVARAERAPDEDLPGDRDRVEHEREEDEELERDLVRGRATPAPIRAQIAAASAKQPSSARRADEQLAADRASGRMRAVAARRVRAARAAARTANATPMPPARSTVPHAEPSRPQSKP